jgi:hypothetical protein
MRSIKRSTNIKKGLELGKIKDQNDESVNQRQHHHNQVKLEHYQNFFRKERANNKKLNVKKIRKTLLNVKKYSC